MTRTDKVFGTRRACEKLLELFIGYSRCLELGDFARSPRSIRAFARPDLLDIQVILVDLHETLGRWSMSHA